MNMLTPGMRWVSGDLPAAVAPTDLQNWLVMWRPWAQVFTAWHLADQQRCQTVEAHTKEELRLRIADAELELWRTSHFPARATPPPIRHAAEVRQPSSRDPGSQPRLRAQDTTPARQASRVRGHHHRPGISVAGHLMDSIMLWALTNVRNAARQRPHSPHHIASPPHEEVTSPPSDNDRAPDRQP